MSATVPTLQVAANGSAAMVKVCGRASFNCSVDFKALMYGLREKGYKRLILDVTDCVIMDSTFLGILAGFSSRLAEVRGEKPRLVLLNPNQKVIDLLENLGVADLFEVERQAEVTGNELEAVESEGGGASKLETSKACLEAHETLMSLNPANVERFKDVARFMREDLKRQESNGG